MQKRRFFRQKLSKIEENFDHNIDPCNKILKLSLDPSKALSETLDETDFKKSTPGLRRACAPTGTRTTRTPTPSTKT
jgi:hypothetical protein